MAYCRQSNDFQGIAFGHHPLITDIMGNKLSKSAGSASLKSIRENRQVPSNLFELAGKLLGLPKEKVEDTATFIELYQAYKSISYE
jgi:glutamyl-tRNA synthetase